MKKFLVLVMALLLIIGCMTIANASETCTEGSQNHDFGTLTAKDATPVSAADAPTCENVGKGTLRCLNCNKDIVVTMPKLDHVKDATADEIQKNQDGSTEFKCGDVITKYVSKCANCKKSYTVPAGTVAHTFDYSNNENGTPKYGTVTPATCTTAKTITYTCTRTGCDGKDVVTVGTKLGHTWTVVTKTVAPTCAASGKAGTYALCSVCSEPYKAEDGSDKITIDGVEYTLDAVEIPQLSHDVDTVWGKAFVLKYFQYDANGNFVGATDYVKGKNKVGEFEDAAFEMACTYTSESNYTHSFTGKSGKVTIDYKPNTCTEGGYLTVKCACGFELTEKNDATEHNYNIFRIKYVDGDGDTQELTIDSVKLAQWFGFEDKTGLNGWSFGYVPYEIVDALIDVIESNYSGTELLAELYAREQLGNITQLDCTIQPIVIFECAYCDEHVRALTKANDAHDFGLTGNTTVAKFEEVLSQLHPIQYTQKLAGHNKAQTYTEYRDIKTCTDFTVKVECKYCIEKATYTITGTGHEGATWFTVDTELRKPTCTETGLNLVKCAKGCGYSVTKPVVALDHVIDPTKTKVVSATCTTTGTRTFVCGREGCEYGKNGEWTETIPSYGHNYTWVETKPATCTEKGVETKTCSRCGATDGTRPIQNAHVIKNLNTNLDKLVLTNVEAAEVFAAAEWLRADEAGNNYYSINPALIQWKDCTKAGSVQFNCVNCYTVTITHEPAAAHSLKKVESLTPAVAYKFIDNEKHQVKTTTKMYCEDCTKYDVTRFDKVDTVDKKHNKARDNMGNVIVKYVTDDQSSCTAAGYAWYKCVECSLTAGYDVWFTDVDPMDTHEFRPSYDTVNAKWTFECRKCGHVEEIDVSAEKYTIDLSKASFGNRSTGYGVAKLSDNLGDYAYLLGERYAYIYMVYENKNGEQTVITKISEIDEDGKFSVKGSSVSATMKLQYVLVAIVDDANADELDLADVKSYGDIVV